MPLMEIFNYRSVNIGCDHGPIFPLQFKIVLCYTKGVQIIWSGSGLSFSVKGCVRSCPPRFGAFLVLKN